LKWVISNGINKFDRQISNETLICSFCQKN
jgi:hypothetical protein